MALGAYQSEASRGGVLNALANPRVVDPVGAIGKAYQTAQSIYQVRSAQADQAWGAALQQATDSDTGVVDYKHAAALASQNPLAAQGMMRNLATASNIQSQQNEQVAQHFALVANQSATLMRDPSDANVKSVVQNFKDAGYPDSMTDALQTRLLSMSPAERSTFAYQHGVGSLGSLDRLNRFTGAPATYQLGGTVQPGVVAAPEAGGGFRPSSGAQPMTPTPEWLGETVPVQDNNKTLPDGTTPNPNYGKSTNVTRGDLLRAAGIDPNKLAGPLGTGRLPAALQNPNKPAVAPATPTDTAPAPTSTPPPAATPMVPRTVSTTRSPADEATIQQAAPRFQAEIDAGTSAQNQQATLGNMLADTAQFTTGPLAGIVGKVRNLAGNLGLNIDTSAQSAKESFNKLAAGLANAQGAGSDQRMQVNINANPHEELSPAGVDLVTRQLQGNADYVQARAKLATQYPNRGDYAGFQQSVANLDPRVFQLSRMTAEQRQTYWKSLDSAAQKQVGDAIRKAKDLGVLGG
jgi:hypothetical protein